MDQCGNAYCTAEHAVEVYDKTATQRSIHGLNPDLARQCHDGQAWIGEAAAPPDRATT